MNEQLQQKYRDVMEAFVERVKQDIHILAVFIAGSLSYDEVWEKSDIDVFLVSDDEKRAYAPFHLVEQGIVFSANLMSRTEFKKSFERVIQSSGTHSILYKSKLVYCKDEAVRDIYERMRQVGDRDRDIQLLMLASYAIVLLEKAEKWIVVKHDVTYSFLYMMKIIEQLAQIEVVLNQEIPTREAIQQALRLRPDFFGAMYTELVKGRRMN
ncbi:nucleotidyltransferase domain-containing protein [Paenibacillus kobensis]|uniref:nucleotidyltransferase domain-containing protein n=1 Tax=Paenibacillus kobensis TaxID=59841 RepID=UPI000FD91719|nr:nucleotidyltransferase domain-containing protein [Paenibacillus kobensis]